MSSQIDIVRKFRTNFSSFKEVWLFTQIFLLSTVMPIILRLISLPKLMYVLTPQDLKLHKDLDLERSKDKIVKFTDYILSHNFWIYKNSCLKRSLLLYHFLNKIGINVRLCLGVKYNKSMISKDCDRELNGHAWLLLNGEIFLERNIEMAREYKVTYCFPSSQRLNEKGIC